jgi:hypothetical protein
MTYWDDRTGWVASHQPLPYDPWEVTPVAPSDDAVRRAVREVMDRRPDWGPSRIKSDLWRQGLDVPVAAIVGVKAGM